MDASTLYDPQFFEMHDYWRDEYVVIADALHRLLPFASVLDLGCGNGFILARLKELGKEVRGVDGSRHALEAAPEEIRPHLSQHDLTRPLDAGAFDLVACMEVAEHLEARFAPALVDTIAGASRRWAYFTAATPGQGGYHHVNEQPHQYWIDLFARRGFRLDSAATDALRGELGQAINTTWWFPRNSMVFEKAG